MIHKRVVHILLGVATLFLNNCIPTASLTPPTPSQPSPTLLKDFVSKSGKTVIQYYGFDSGTCGTGIGCTYREVINTPKGFNQVEVFLSGFTLRMQASVDKVQHLAVHVQKFRYDLNSGDLDIGISGVISSQTSQAYSYQVTFVVLLTNTNAVFTKISTGCTGTAYCHIGKYLAGAVPTGLIYIGLGSSHFDLGSNSSPLKINLLSMSLDHINVQNPPDISIDYVCALRDAKGVGDMFCEWDASVIAFDAQEMDRNDSIHFPLFTAILSSTGPTIWNQQLHPYSGGSISGYFDVLEGLSFWYGAGIENAIWLIDGSASNYQIFGSPPMAGGAQYGIFLGTTFGDKSNAQLYSAQIFRAIGLLR